MICLRDVYSYFFFCKKNEEARRLTEKVIFEILAHDRTLIERSNSVNNLIFIQITTTVFD